MATLSLHNTMVCFLLIVLASFAFLQPIGYLASGLVGALGAKIIKPKEDNTGLFPPTSAVSFLRFVVIGFCLIVIVARHYGAWQ